MTDNFQLGGASYRSLCFQLLEELEKHAHPTNPVVVKARNVLAPPANARHFKRGEQNFAAILTPELVRKMRQLRDEGWTYPQLAKEFDVDRKHAWRICNRDCWAWVK